jgi:hypothetical protein
LLAAAALLATLTALSGLRRLLTRLLLAATLATLLATLVLLIHEKLLDGFRSTKQRPNMPCVSGRLANLQATVLIKCCVV